MRGRPQSSRVRIFDSARTKKGIIIIGSLQSTVESGRKCRQPGQSRGRGRNPRHPRSNAGAPCKRAGARGSLRSAVASGPKCRQPGQSRGRGRNPRHPPACNALRGLTANAAGIKALKPRHFVVCITGFQSGPAVVEGEYPGGGYMALELIFVSARTNKRHHHHRRRDVSVT